MNNTNVTNTEAIENNSDKFIEKTSVDNSENENNVSNEQDSIEDTIIKLKAELEVSKNQYLRTLADYDNYRKNAIKERSNLLKYKSETLAKEIIAVVDDFERAFNNININNNPDMVGIKLIYNKLIRVLERNNIKAIDVKEGDSFDENIHEALTMLNVDDPNKNRKIIGCTEKGYKLVDKVIRYAKVVVGNYISPKHEENNDNSNDNEENKE